MSGGRPTIYNEDVQAKADWYVDDGWREVGDAIPSQAGLCVELGIARSTLFVWRDKHGGFKDTLGRLEQSQERVALSGGMKNEFNSTITKLVLANHGYSDRNAVDHTSSDGSMSPQGKSLDDFYNDVPTEPES